MREKNDLHTDIIEKKIRLWDKTLGSALAGICAVLCVAGAALAHICNFAIKKERHR